MKKLVNLIWWNLDPQSSYEFDWLNRLLDGFSINHVYDFSPDDVFENAIVVANLSQVFFHEKASRKVYAKKLGELRRFIEVAKRSGQNIGLFHLGDEYYQESTSFYKDFDFIFRQYYKSEAHRKHDHCYYLPIGYKSDFIENLNPTPIESRDYLWSFAGHLKGSRYSMMKHASAIPGGKCFTTTQWNDPNGLTTESYAALLSNTKFSLCPMGNYSVDCFRVYESLEAGTIPIVETKGILESLAVLTSPKLLIKHGSRDRKFWLRNYRYWQNAYADSFPCPLIYRWSDLPKTIDTIDVPRISAEIQDWWNSYKTTLLQLAQQTVEDVFKVHP